MNPDPPTDQMRSRDVQRVIQTGKRLHCERMVLLLAPGSGDSAAVAGRRVGGSVQRNRARRIVRAAIRQIQPALASNDLVVIARPAIDGCTTDDLVREMKELLA